MTKTLSIAMDGRSLRGERTGVGRYAASLIEHLVAEEPDLRVVLVADGDIPELPGAASGRVELVRRPAGTNNLYWSNVQLRRGLRGRTIDLFHSPGYTLPIGLSMPSIVSLHDVSYAARPEWYPHRSGPLRRAWYRASARRADHVLTISEFSRREILRVYGLPPERVTSIYLGVDPRRFRRVNETGRLDDLRRRHRLAADFLLFVGDVHARRNLRRAVDALSMLRSMARREIELVVVGRILEPEPALARPGVRHLGYVPEDDLPLLYSAARAFVFTSFYEGFGLGVAEAMSCGCPVIVGKGTACDEVAGEAGVAVDPRDVGALADAARAFLRDPDLASRYSEAGRARARSFDWGRTARETLEVYRVVARRGAA
jgi:alpha-1,3-rhamnosyl/mannosyltransferase